MKKLLYFFLILSFNMKNHASTPPKSYSSSSTESDSLAIAFPFNQPENSSTKAYSLRKLNKSSSGSDISNSDDSSLQETKINLIKYAEDVNKHIYSITVSSGETEEDVYTKIAQAYPFVHAETISPYFKPILIRRIKESLLIADDLELNINQLFKESIDEFLAPHEKELLEKNELNIKLAKKIKTNKRLAKGIISANIITAIITAVAMSILLKFGECGQ